MDFSIFRGAEWENPKRPGIELYILAPAALTNSRTRHYASSWIWTDWAWMIWGKEVLKRVKF
jgi:hypothetical protein